MSCPNNCSCQQKSQREHDTDLCQEMPTTGPPALASCSFASSRRVLSRRRLHIVCLTSCQVGIYTSPYSPWHTSPPLSPSLHGSDFDIRLVSCCCCCCYLSSSARVQRYSVDGTMSCARYLHSGAYQQHMTMSIADAAIKPKGSNSGE